MAISAVDFQNIVNETTVVFLTLKTMSRNKCFHLRDFPHAVYHMSLYAFTTAGYITQDRSAIK